MRRLFLLLVVLMSTFSFLPGCGDGGSKSSPAEQEKRLTESKANMEQGMKAMKALKSAPKSQSK
jgi:hypothetical protein